LKFASRWAIKLDDTFSVSYPKLRILTISYAARKWLKTKRLHPIVFLINSICFLVG